MWYKLLVISPSCCSEQHQARLDQYVAILRDNCSRYLFSETRSRLQMLLGSLVNMGLRHRDIMQSKFPMSHGHAATRA